MDIFFYYFFIFILVGNFKLVQPLLMLVLFDKGKDGLKTFLDISDYSDISPDIFIYFGRIDLEVLMSRSDRPTIGSRTATHGIPSISPTRQ